MRLIEGEIDKLKIKIFDMAELVQLQFDLLAQAMHHPDPKLASKIKQKEQEIDSFDNKIDKRCARILALYHPVADDLRFVFSTLKVNSMLEQIGDLINFTARKAIALSEPIDPDFLEELHQLEMVKQTNEILTTSLNAFFTRNTELARSVFDMDDRVDELYHRAFDKISERLEANPAHARDYLNLCMIFKTMEKIADFGIDISKETIFMIDAVVYKHRQLHLGASDAETSGSPLEDAS